MGESSMKILIACEYSGRVREAFRNKGHDAWSCDLLPSEDGSEFHIQGDVTELLNQDWDMLIAHPPCTRLANSGVRWMKAPPKGKTLEEIQSEFEEAVRFYKLFQECSIPKKCIENPIMHRYAKEKLDIKNRQVVQPHYFGEEMFKATGYELYGLPSLERTHFMDLPKKGEDEYKKWSWVHYCPPSPDRWKIRSRTPGMIAKAMAEKWG